MGRMGRTSLYPPYFARPPAHARAYVPYMGTRPMRPGVGQTAEIRRSRRPVARLRYKDKRMSRPREHCGGQGGRVMMGRIVKWATELAFPSAGEATRALAISRGTPTGEPSLVTSGAPVMGRRTNARTFRP